MDGHRTEATVGQHRELVLQGLPFEPGQPVEVVVRPAGASATKKHCDLRGSVLEYRDPFAPVAEEDWDASR